MFTIRSFGYCRAVVRARPTRESAEIMALVARMRVVAKGDVHLARLLEELSPYLPDTSCCRDVAQDTRQDV